MKANMLLLMISAMAISTATAGETDKRLADSRAAINEFATALQSELTTAMQNGGPINAIQACNLKAPAITAAISKKHGWQVGRTTLKLRNPANAPDAWERKVLESFESRKQAGESPATLEFHEVVDSNGKKAFRYMKAIAIPENAPCLVCHGSAIDQKLQAKLTTLYPNDQATGYTPGALRGAFSIRQPM